MSIEVTCPACAKACVLEELPEKENRCPECGEVLTASARGREEPVPGAAAPRRSRKAWLLVGGLVVAAGLVVLLVFNLAWVYLRLGQNALEEHRYEEAIGHLTKAIDLRPNFKEAFVARAEAYLGLAAYERAVKDCTSALLIDARFVKAYQVRSEAHELLGHDLSADEDRARAAKLEGDQ